MHPGQIAASQPNHAAVIAGETVLSYAELDAQSRAAAGHLAALGVHPGDTVALLAGNGPGFLVAAWAAQRSGLHYVPISTRLLAHEVAYILADSGAAVVMTDGSYAPLAQDACAQLEVPPKLLSVEPLVGVPMLGSAGEAAASPELEGSDMLYTSGTTGKPKGVRKPLTQAPLGADARRAERSRVLFEMGPDTRFLSPAPLYHAAPLRFAMTVLRLGGTVVLQTRFDAEQALTLIARHRITHSQWVPTMFSRLLALPEAVRAGHDLSSHRVAIHAGAPCPVGVKQAMIDWWGPILHEYYSGSESVGFTHVSASDWLRHPGTVGRGYGCTVHVVGEDGAELPAGETGMVYFESTATLAYHNDPEKSAAARHPKGWVTLGDIGHVNAEGFLFLSDRKAFTIVSGGVNIYPREIEEALLSHPAVADAAVFGVVDADLGEAVQAVVQLEPAHAADEATAATLFGHLRAVLAPFKHPRCIAFADTLPRTETGKLLKAQLKAEFGGKPAGFARPYRSLTDAA